MTAQTFSGTDVFTIAGGNLRHRWWEGEGWSSLTDMDAPAPGLTDVAAARHEARTDLFVTDGTDLWQRWWGPDNGWSEWTSWGPGTGPLAAGSMGASHAEIFFFDSAGTPKHSWNTGDGWSESIDF